MNSTSKKSLLLSVIMCVGAAFFISGCGPENLDDPNYFAADAADKTDAPVANEPAAPAKMPAMKGAAVSDDDGQPVPPVASVPAIQLPDRYVRLPSQYSAQPTIVTRSGEQINYQQNVLHERNIHIAQPAVEEHQVNRNYHRNDLFHTNVINHPSFRKNVFFTATASESAAELPTTVVTLPTTAYAGCGGFGGGYLSGRPFCAPYYSGGFLRNCGSRVLP